MRLGCGTTFKNVSSTNFFSRVIHEAIQLAQRVALNDRERPMLAKFSVLVETLAFFLVTELRANDLMAFVNSPCFF